MSGLIDSVEGLRYGIGLYFEPGLGGRGLINPTDGHDFPDSALLTATGSLALSATVRRVASAMLSGAGSVIVDATVV